MLKTWYVRLSVSVCHLIPTWICLHSYDSPSHLTTKTPNQTPRPRDYFKDYILFILQFLVESNTVK
jgi:hypothetical protein